MKKINFFLLLIPCLVFWTCSGSKDLSTTKIKLVKPTIKKGLTSSGYKYIHYIANEGAKVKAGDEVVFHLVVMKNDTTKLQSTYEKIGPFTQVMPDLERLPKPIPPTFEAMVMMTSGDSLQVSQGLDSIQHLPPGFSNSDILNFRIKLVSIKTKEALAIEKEQIMAKEKPIEAKTVQLIKAYQEKKLEEKIQTTTSGLKYIIHKKGTGKHAIAGKKVKAHYAGFLLNGSPFDNSYKRAEAFEFILGKGMVIKGWDEGMALLSEGAEATFFIPYSLAYGEAGRPPSIPAKSELVFFIELLEVGQ